MDFLELEKKRKEHLLGGGKGKQEDFRKKGKLTAFESMDSLFDSGTLRELDSFVTHECSDFGMEKKEVLGDGVVTGHGAINGRLAYAFSHDFTFLGGSLGWAFASKVCKIMDLALKQGVPIIGINELGGALIHNQRSGVAHFLVENEQECFRTLRMLLSFIPSNNLENPPRIAPKDTPNREDDELNSILPPNPNKSYDMEVIIRKIVDSGDFLEVQKYWARNIIVGFARLDGNSVGIVANNPEVLAGVLDIDSCNKAARFVRFCDCFNIPLIALVDVPGFLPGTNQEWGGIIRHGSKLLYAFSEATVPKLTIITRKAYGGAYDVMNSKHIGADYNFAWPTAEIAVMGPEGACNIIFRKEISGSKDPQKKREELVQDYRTKFANPYVAASKGYIDDVIEPKETRARLISSLKSIYRKRADMPKRKHGNIPV